VALAVLGLVVAIAIGVVAWPSGSDPVRAPRPRAAAADPLARAPEIPAPPPPLPPRWGAIAVVPAVAVFDAPGAASPSSMLSHPTHEGIDRVFSVLEHRGDWLRVLLNVRPNSSTGWIRASEVRLHDTPLRIVVDRAAHQLTLLQGHDVVFSAPVAIGTARTPTPIGTFYVDAIVPTNPNSVWGAFQLSVSGFSEVHKTFMGGSGQIAIHGTNRPGLIGQNVSNGCVRMRNADITEVANRIVLGTPVDIVN
jgi:lipoprotein-anchoring transpeptidase ErfK/SrfK